MPTIPAVSPRFCSSAAVQDQSQVEFDAGFLQQLDVIQASGIRDPTRSPLLTSGPTSLHAYSLPGNETIGEVPAQDVGMRVGAYDALGQALLMHGLGVTPESLKPRTERSANVLLSIDGTDHGHLLKTLENVKNRLATTTGRRIGHNSSLRGFEAVMREASVAQETKPAPLRMQYLEVAAGRSLTQNAPSESIDPQKTNSSGISETAVAAAYAALQADPQQNSLIKTRKIRNSPPLGCYALQKAEPIEVQKEAEEQKEEEEKEKKEENAAFTAHSDRRFRDIQKMIASWKGSAHQDGHRRRAQDIVIKGPLVGFKGGEEAEGEKGGAVSVSGNAKIVEDAAVAQQSLPEAKGHQSKQKEGKRENDSVSCESLLASLSASLLQQRAKIADRQKKIDAANTKPLRT